jgi:hypothetical protein
LSLAYAGRIDSDAATRIAVDRVRARAIV